MKYQRYYLIWTIDDELDESNFLMLIEDIEDGYYKKQLRLFLYKYY
jgi:hypothetical protein